MDGPALRFNPFSRSFLCQHKQYLHFEVVLLIATLTVVQLLPDWIVLLLQKFVKVLVDIHLAAIPQHLVVLLVMGLEVGEEMFFGVDARLEDDF